MDFVIVFFRDILDGPLYIAVSIVCSILICSCIGYMGEKYLVEKKEGEEFASKHTSVDDKPLTAEEARKAGADIVIMLHPDYQYTPKLIPAIASMMAFGEYDAVIASRMLGNSALKGGMPIYKWISNRFLTEFQNFVIGQKLSEYHTGFRGFTREILEKLPLEDCSDDFIFDNQMLALILYKFALYAPHQT